MTKTNTNATDILASALASAAEQMAFDAIASGGVERKTVELSHDDAWGFMCTACGAADRGAAETMTIDINATVRAALASHEAAFSARVELDVAKWGEAEREASVQMRRAEGMSHGLLVNSIVHDEASDFGDAVNADLRRAAKKLLTAADHLALRS